MADWRVLSEKIHEIFYIYGNVGFSILAGLFCVFIIVILHYAKVPKEAKMMYDFLVVNSAFNITFIIVKNLKPLSICWNEYFFCSEYLGRSVYTQYFNVIFIKLIGKSLKSASNLKHIAFITLHNYREK